MSVEKYKITVVIEFSDIGVSQSATKPNLVAKFLATNSALAITPSHQQNTHDFADGRKNMNDIINNYVCSASHMRSGLHFQNVWRELCWTLVLYQTVN